MTPCRMRAGEEAAVLALLRRAFAPMEGRIAPHSSLHRLTEAGIAEQAGTGEIWLLGDPLVACLFLSLKPDRLYLGKLAVEPARQGTGLARVLVDHAAGRARALGLSVLELQTRVELSENHAAFAAMGFVETGRTCHPGFDRPTSVTLQRGLD